MERRDLFRVVGVGAAAGLLVESTPWRRLIDSSAAIGDVTGTSLALERAVTAFDYARPRTERVWTPFFISNRLGSLLVSAYSRVGHPELERTADDLLNSLSPTDNKVRAIVLSDLAVASVQQKDFARADELVTRALTLTLRTETLLARDKLSMLREKLPATDAARSIGDRLANAGL